MFVAGNAVQGLAKIVELFLQLYMWIIIARALVSWVNPDPWNPIVQFLERATEPVLAPFLAILIIVFLQYAVVASLYEVAAQLH
jgi:YggT family protein